LVGNGDVLYSYNWALCWGSIGCVFILIRDEANVSFKKRRNLADFTIKIKIKIANSKVNKKS
jgi:hypothetical protein